MDEDSVKALGLAVVTDIAPAELALFGPISRAWIADPRPARHGRGGDEALGFGVAEAATLLTPVILTVATRAVELLAEELGKAFIKDTADEIAARIRRLVRHDGARDELSGEQLARIRDAAVLSAQAQKLPTGEAEKLADAVAAHLAHRTTQG